MRHKAVSHDRDGSRAHHRAVPFPRSWFLTVELCLYTRCLTRGVKSAIFSGAVTRRARWIFLVPVEISGWRDQVGYVLARGLARALLNCCFSFSHPAGLPRAFAFHYAAGRKVEHSRWKKKKAVAFAFFTFLLLTSTRHTVRLCHQWVGQTAVCDIRGENTWRELGRFVEILHVLSFLLIDGELPVTYQSLMS